MLYMRNSCAVVLLLSVCSCQFAFASKDEPSRAVNSRVGNSSLMDCAKIDDVNVCGNLAACSWCVLTVPSMREAECFNKKELPGPLWKCFDGDAAAGALATAVAVEQESQDTSVMPTAELKPEYINNSSLPSAIAGGSNSPVFVFLQKFPLLGRFLGFLEVYHTEVLVCPRGGFTDADQATLDEKIAGMKDFAEIDKSWWSTRSANCVELGYGGASCSDECCSVGVDKSYALQESRSVISNADLSKRSLYIYGTGNFDGSVAYYNTCNQKCWSNWAGTDYNIITNNCNTFTSTVLHSVYSLSEKKPNLGVSDMVTVHGHCPANDNSAGLTELIV